MPKGATYRSSEVDDKSADVVEISRTDDGVLLRVVPVVRFTPTGDGGYSMHVDPKAAVHAVGIPWRAWVDFVGEAHSEVYNVTLPSAHAVYAVLDGAPNAIKPFAVHVAGTGELIGELISWETAHRIAHMFLGAWPDLAPLILTDRTRNASWTVQAGACTPLGCDVALTCATDPGARRAIAESRAGRARGEFTTGEEPRAPFHLLPPIPRPPVGYPVRRVDLETLRRVVEGLRRL